MIDEKIRTQKVVDLEDMRTEIEKRKNVMRNQALGVVKPEIKGNVNFKIKSQFMRELREDTFVGNKNDYTYELVEKKLDIITMFNILGVTHNAVMLCVFPITLNGAAKRYNDHLYKCPTHDLINHQKVNIFYNGLDDMTRQLLDSQGPIPNKTPAQALTAIQTMSDHSQKWHDGSTSRRDVKTMEELTLTRNVRYTKSLLDEEVQDETQEDEEINNEATQQQHVEEALIHKAMKSLKRININRPLLKEIRKTDDYTKHMKNLLPRKEQDPESLSLPCSIRKLTFNALADLGASISVMPLLMFKRLGIGGLKPINMTIEMVDRTQKMSPNTGEDREDLKNFGDAKMELILSNVFDKLDDEWFSGTVIDEEDLDGIVDYLELKSYDGFIDVIDEAYKKKLCKLLGMTYETPTPILIEKVEITRYTIGPGECYTKGRSHKLMSYLELVPMLLQ
uniref:Reverse transcriptase domain-containing protein n=1 Tax=Tanacetum cinerariifolium TaxID=118510 RepID=A0A6L2L7F6_TANCI|nr:hypothetical protein [Tanacetum cinerariifolium]